MRPPRRRPPPGRWLGLAAMVALLWFLGGRAGLVLGLVIAVIDLVRPLAPRLLLLGALLLLLAVPLVLLARGLPTRATLSPEFVSGSLVPHLLAGSALALLVLGVLFVNVELWMFPAANGNERLHCCHRYGLGAFALVASVHGSGHLEFRMYHSG